MISLLLQSLSNLTIQGQIKMVDIMSLPAKEHCMCVKCKAMLAFSPEDVTSFVERIYIGQAQKRFFLMCPNCDHKIVSSLPWFPVGSCE